MGMLLSSPHYTVLVSVQRGDIKLKQKHFSMEHYGAYLLVRAGF